MLPHLDLCFLDNHFGREDVKLALGERLKEMPLFTDHLADADEQAALDASISRLLAWQRQACRQRREGSDDSCDRHGPAEGGAEAVTGRAQRKGALKL